MGNRNGFSNGIQVSGIKICLSFSASPFVFALKQLIDKHWRIGKLERGLEKSFSHSTLVGMQVLLKHYKDIIISHKLMCSV